MAGARAALLFLDLDGFKEVNDRHGHQAGDLLLAAVAKRVLASVRDDDLERAVVARHPLRGQGDVLGGRPWGGGGCRRRAGARSSVAHPSIVAPPGRAVRRM